MSSIVSKEAIMVTFQPLKLGRRVTKGGLMYAQVYALVLGRVGQRAELIKAIGILAVASICVPVHLLDLFSALVPYRRRAGDWPLRLERFWWTAPGTPKVFRWA